jgi:uncharacterized protein (TIGR02453 family)
MIQPSTLRFLRDLAKNNTRDWFEQNRDRFENAKSDFDAFIAKLLKELSKIDPTLGGLEVKDCVFRIYRDVRFSKNKTPYKVNFSASIKSGGRKSNKCGFYIQVEPKGDWGSFLAGGYWMPEAPVLRLLRQEVEYNTDEFKKIIGNRNFKKWFNELEDHKLKKAPKGVDPEHPDMELLKYTSFIATHALTDKEILSDDFLKICVNGYKSMKPLLDFLNRAVEK